MKTIIYNILFLLVCSMVSFKGEANPYWRKDMVPKDSAFKSEAIRIRGQGTGLNSTLKVLDEVLPEDQSLNPKEALRITVQWNSETEEYSLARAVVENSGTDSLYLRSEIEPKWGSYQGRIYLGKSKKPLYYDSIGTGKEYRKLVPQISFRFPVPDQSFRFELIAENPVSGEMEVVLEKNFDATQIETESYKLETMEYRVLRKALSSPALKVGIYADGYLAGTKETFWKDARRVVDSLVSSGFAGVDSMEFIAVFAPSNLQLGRAQDLGLPVKARDSFLGLYYPYWNNFGRWYHIVYPTSEEKFRKNLALIPYDYNLVLMDSADYWGVGNYKTHMAIPSRAQSFVYLLLHEIGHYFGLNEEYEGGGRTELEFAYEIKEVWSQNMTLLPEQQLSSLKWSKHVEDLSTPIPTPKSFWKPGKYGAFEGGYADSPAKHGKSHKPSLGCVMDRYSEFCKVCKGGIQAVVDRDLGIAD